MAHMKCRCGHIMWNTKCPNDIELWVFSDRTINEISENEEFDTFFLVDKNDYNVWCCPECKRLYVFDEKYSVHEPICVYKLEE